MQARGVIAVGKKAVEVRSVEIGAPGEWDLVAEVECSGLSVGTESYCVSRAEPDKPWIVGYAPVARVTWVGVRAAGQFSPGDRVTYFAPRPPDAASGVSQMCGAYQSPAILTVDPQRGDRLAPNAYCVKVPGSLSSEEAAFAGISSVSYLAAEMSGSRAGDKVLILGQGIIGLYATQHFILRGAEVCVADLHDKRLDAAALCGADHRIHPGREDLVQAVHARWPSGADIIVDSTANYRVVEQSLPALRTTGKYVFLGYYKAGDFNLGKLHGRVFDAFFPWTLQGRLVVASMGLMTRGLLKARELISHRFPVSEAARAYEFVFAQPDQYTGILLDWRCS